MSYFNFIKNEIKRKWFTAIKKNKIIGYFLCRKPPLVTIGLSFWVLHVHTDRAI